MRACDGVRRRVQVRHARARACTQDKSRTARVSTHAGLIGKARWATAHVASRRPLLPAVPLLLSAPAVANRARLPIREWSRAHMSFRKMTNGCNPSESILLVTATHAGSAPRAVRLAALSGAAGGVGFRLRAATTDASVTRITSIIRGNGLTLGWIP